MFTLFEFNFSMKHKSISPLPFFSLPFSNPLPLILPPPPLFCNILIKTIKMLNEYVKSFEVYLSTYISHYLSIYLCYYLCIYISYYLSIFLTIFLYILLSIYLYHNWSIIMKFNEFVKCFEVYGSGARFINANIQINTYM